MNNEREKKELNDKIHQLEQERLYSELRNLKEQNNVNTNIGIANLAKPSGGNVVVQQQQAVNASSPIVVYEDGRLTYPFGIYCLFLLLNLFLPGVGSIVAGILYGKTSRLGDRTGNLICHGIAQLIFAITIFGWVWAIRDALNYFARGSNYFARGSCSICACFD